MAEIEMMAAKPDIPAAWIGTEELPLHFANAFGVVGAPYAVFLVAGSIVPGTVEGPGDAVPPFVPIKPIARLALAPAAVPQLIEGLQEALKQHEAALAEANKQQRG